MTLALSMIVRNESKVIRRCLQSVKGIIDYYAIVDTGSTDGTQDIIRECLKGLPGKIIDEPFVDFATNRNQALKLAREYADWAFFIDAKDELVFTDKYRNHSFHPDNSVDGYEIDIHYRSLVYKRTSFVNLDKPWKWEGVLHESLVGGKPVPLGGPYIQCHPGEGYRGQDPANRFKSDVEVLSKELDRDPSNPRTQFYLAQSLRDAGMIKPAYEAYKRRAGMTGFDEESWHAQYQAAALTQQLDFEEWKVIREYVAAYEMRPHRAEPLYWLCEYLRNKRCFNLAYLFGNTAVKIPYPENDRLFVESDVYKWKMHDTFAICCHETKRQDEAIEHGTAAINANPNDKRLISNMAFYLNPKREKSMTKVNLGCGRNIMPGWINVDCVKLDGVDLVADFDKCADTPLKMESDSVDEFLASHLFEHLRNPLPFMQELHRIAKPGAKAVFHVPYGSSDDADEDPTHVRRCFLQTFGYFSQPYYWRADYQYCGDWNTDRIQLVIPNKDYKGMNSDMLMAYIKERRNIVSEMIVHLTAVKPIREPKRELQTIPPIEFVF